MPNGFQTLETVPCITPNAPGVSVVHAVAQKDIDTIPAEVAGEITTNVTLDLGIFWVPIEFDEDSADFQIEVLGLEVDSKTYMATITLFSPGTSAAKDAAVDKFMGNRTIIAIKDVDGQTMLIGNQDRGCRMQSANIERNVAGENRKGTELIITCKSSTPFPRYTGTLPTS